MSEAIPVQHESAVAILRELASETDTEIQGLERKIELARERHGGFLDAIARLTRTPRARRPRVVVDSTPANDQAAADHEETSTRPTVFATPSSETIAA